MKENKLNTFFSWFLLAVAFLLPLFFVPYLINPLINSKLLLIIFTALITGVIFLLFSIQKKSWELIKSPLNLPLLVFAVLVVISGLASYQYPSKQFLGMGGVYLSSIAIVLIAPSLVQAKFSKWFSTSVNVSALILSLLSVLQILGLGLSSIISQISIFELPNNLSFNLTGATFILIQFLSVVLLSNLFDQKTLKHSIFNKLVTFVIALALIINVRAILPGGEAAFQSLSFVNSVNVAFNSLALTRTALLGYGPDSYGNAYNILKPVWVNGTEYWKFTFDSAFNLPLTIIVSLGGIAFMVYLLFMWQTFSLVKKDDGKEPFLKAFVISSLVWQLFSPINVLMLILMAIALALFISSHQNQFKKLNFNVHHLSDLLNQGKWTKARKYVFFGVTAVALLAITSFTITSAKAFYSYHLLYRSNEEIIKNEAPTAYDFHKKAKEITPQLDFIRRSYAMLNLQIAVALSNKADLDPAEQEQVLQLINQAIREAKAATVLDPANYQNWLTLAQIYMQLIETTPQATQESFNALAEAVTYNPNDPDLRIILGELFLKTKKSQEAIVFFNQAIERKPDLFIAHYYLAQSLIENNQLEEAKVAFTSALGLLSKESEEYKAVDSELKALNEEIEKVKNNQKSNEPQTPEATDSATLETSLENGDSILSDLLDQEETETIIQDGALTPDQEFVEE